MNKEKQKIVPELRFPEFENDKEWKIEPLNDVYDFKITNSFSRDKLNYQKGTVKNIHYGDIHTKFSTHFDITKENVPYINPETPIERIDEDNYCKEGDLIIADASEDIDDIGKSIEIINLNKEKLLAGLHTFLARPIDSKITNGFGGHLFKSNGIRIQIKKEAQGTKVLGISKGRLANLDIYYPENVKEQQKISNCLSSLDNLITTETERLGNLKEHKKGLLQQLFPANGETQPQYRFPEFKNDGDWEETILNEVADYSNGKAHEKEISSSGKYKVVNSKFISTDGKTIKYSNSANLKAYIGDILMVLSDIPNGKAIAKCFYVDKNDTYTVNQRICKITPTKIDNKLLFYIQNRNSYFLSFDDGVKQTNLRIDTVLSFPFLKPKDLKEQQKIANCLSSADNLIEAQKERVKDLKKHKKGLMQQLFPNVIDEAI